MSDIKTTEILGTLLSTERISDIRKKIIKSLKESKQKFYIVTPNPELIMIGLREKSYQDILNQAQFSIPDGVGVLMASKILKKGIKGRLPGVDFMQELVVECAKEGLTVGFFGGGAGVAEKTSECLQKSYPNLKVVFAGSEWEPKKIAGGRIDLLFVALGSPKQEKWIAENLPKIPVTSAMGVGGSFDFVSGKVKRAPKFIRNMGAEWLFRLVLQPWRIKRQLVLPKFALFVLKEKLTS